MASLQRLGTDENSRWRIQFSTACGRRATIRLGTARCDSAEEVKRHVEDLAASRALGTEPDAVTKKWLTQIGARLSAQLRRYRLIDEPDAVGDAKGDEPSDSWEVFSLEAGRLDLKLSDALSCREASQFAKDCERDGLCVAIRLAKEKCKP